MYSTLYTDAPIYQARLHVDKGGGLNIWVTNTRGASMAFSIEEAKWLANALRALADTEVPRDAPENRSFAVVEFSPIEEVV